MTVARFDNGLIKSSSVFTEEGFLKCNAIVTRCGVFSYITSDGNIIRELRHPEDVLNSTSLDSMKMIPVTNDHPSERLVTAQNAKNLSVGFTGENVINEDKFIYTNFVVTDSNTIKEIVDFGKNQLSLGYTVDLVMEKGEYEGELYDARQTNIRYNHLSIVQNARAGENAKIVLDSKDAVEILKREDENVMVKRKVKIDEEEFLMEPEMAESVETLLKDFENLSDEKKRVEEELAMIKDKLEKALAERDTAKEQAESLLKENGELKEEKMDAKEIGKRVSARLSLLKVAESVLDSETLKKLDDESDLEIKKRIILSKSKQANLDGKSEVYINARYDAILEDLPKNQVVIGDSVKSESKQDSNNAEKARQRMIENMKNAYKVEEK